MFVLDGKPFDIGCISLAFMAVLYRLIRNKISRGAFEFDRNIAFKDAMSGASIFPFFLMISSIFSSHVRNYFLDNGLLYLGLAGFVGLVFTFDELTRP
jgi:hypothetical protein